MRINMIVDNNIQMDVDMFDNNILLVEYEKILVVEDNDIVMYDCMELN